MAKMKAKTRSSPKRLIIDIPDKIHADIKARAAHQNITIKAWLVRIIVKAFKEEDKYL